MHPSKLFKEMKFKINSFCSAFELYDEEVKRSLENVQAKNFIRTKITLPVYKITISYFTSNNNYKTSDKYMILDKEIDEEYYDMWAEMFVQDYAKEHNLRNVEIIECIHMCDGVLPVG